MESDLINGKLKSEPTELKGTSILLMITSLLALFCFHLREYYPAVHTVS